MIVCGWRGPCSLTNEPVADRMTANETASETEAPTVLKIGDWFRLDEADWSHWHCGQCGSEGSAEAGQSLRDHLISAHESQ